MLANIGIGGGPLSTVLAAPFSRTHYVAICNASGTYAEPIDSLKIYLLNAGEYPHTVRVKSPIGILQLNTYTWHDMLTISEIFCRKDYRADPRDEVVVDFGSNIGIPAAYFLSQSPRSHVFSLSRCPSISSGCKRISGPFKGDIACPRWLSVFRMERPSLAGRKATIRRHREGTGHNLIVECVDSNKILEGIIAMHDRIDILKIDIETLEEPVTSRIPLEIAKKINKVYVEYAFASNPLGRVNTI
jgi:hypothetical protein